MTQEDKELLIKDLCGRLPYGVKFHYTKHPQSNIDQDCDGTAIGYYCNLIVSANDKDFCVDRCKLYLRPMSSMTGEEIDEFTQFDVYANGEYVIPNHEAIDWLNEHYIDYRGLIPKGLAIAVTEENNPYKE